MNRHEIPVTYLLRCSKSALQNVILTCLNRAAELRRTARESAEEATREEAFALFARFLEEHGEEILTLGEVSEKTDDGAVTAKPGPQHWRAEVRRLRKAG